MTSFYLRMPRWLRIAILLAILGVLAAVKAGQIRRWPKPAPEDVQKQGMAMLTNSIATLSVSPFGETQRGQILCRKLSELASNGTVVFSADMERQAQYMGDPVGLRRLYVRVLKLGNGEFIQMRPWHMADAAFHETVHAVRGAIRPSSIEEECDAYVAGSQAATTLSQKPFPARLTLDGVSIAEFVTSNYPGLGSNPKYQPVGQTREWLAKIAELQPYSALRATKDER